MSNTKSTKKTQQSETAYRAVYEKALKILEDNKEVINFKREDRETFIKEVAKLKKFYYSVGDEEGEKERIKGLSTRLINRSLGMGVLSQVYNCFYDIKSDTYRVFNIVNGEMFHYKETSQALKRILKGFYGMAKIGEMPRLSNIPTRTIKFEPSKPSEYWSESEMFEVFNMFQESQTLRKRGKVPPVKEIAWHRVPHIEATFNNVFPEKEHRDYFVNWLGYILQRREKARTAVISLGATQGVGKGTIWETIIEYAVGSHYTLEIGNEDLKSQFNGLFEGKLFVLANEIKGDFRDGNSIYAKLKRAIADKNMIVENKKVNKYQVENYLNFWFNSNEELPVQIDKQDRRYSVFPTSTIKLDHIADVKFGLTPSAFKKKIIEERDTFLDMLMGLVIDEQKATTPLETEAKKRVIEGSTPKKTLLKEAILSKDMEDLETAVVDASEDEAIASIMAKFGGVDGFLTELKKELSANYLSNPVFTALYRAYVDHTHSSRKIGIVGNVMLGKPIVTKIKTNGGSKTVRVRKFKPNHNAKPLYTITSHKDMK
jgi:hypothetical protein